MSKYQKPCLYNGRGLDNQWLNIIYNAHDLMCGCNTVQDHLLDVLNIKKCLHSTEENTTAETTGTGDNDEMPFDAKDLEMLFEENPADDG